MRILSIRRDDNDVAEQRGPVVERTIGPDYIRLDSQCAAAAATLRKICDCSSAPHLLSAIVWRPSKVREAAKSALDSLDAAWVHAHTIKAAVPTLLQRLRLCDRSDWNAERNGRHEDVRPLITEYLRQVGDSGAVPTLVECLASTDNNIRRDAATILAEIDASWATEDGSIAELTKLLVSVDTTLRHESLRALKVMYPDWQQSIGARDALPVIRDALNYQSGNKQTDLSIRTAAMTAVGALGDHASTGRLVKALLESQAASLRSAAAAALIAIRDPLAIKPIVEQTYKNQPPDYFLSSGFEGQVLKAIDPHWMQSDGAASAVPFLLEGADNHPVPWMLIGATGDIRAAAYRYVSACRRISSTPYAYPLDS